MLAAHFARHGFNARLHCINTMCHFGFKLLYPSLNGCQAFIGAAQIGANQELAQENWSKRVRETQIEAEQHEQVNSQR